MNDELNFDLNKYPYFYTWLTNRVGVKGMLITQYHYGLFGDEDGEGYYDLIDYCSDAVIKDYIVGDYDGSKRGLVTFIFYIIQNYYSNRIILDDYVYTYSPSYQIAVDLNRDFEDIKSMNKIILRDARTRFINSLSSRLVPHLEEWNNKYNLGSFFGNLSKEELLAINNISDINTTSSNQEGSSKENSQSGNNVVQKYANNPTAVDPTSESDTININLDDGSFKASGFQSKYQNASANTEQLATTGVSRTNMAKRSSNASYTRKHTGNIKLIEDIYERLPKGFVNEVIECVAPLFINVE